MYNILKPSVNYFKCFIFAVARFQRTIYAKVNRNVRIGYLFTYRLVILLTNAVT